MTDLPAPFRRGDGLYVARWTDQRGQRRQVTSKSWREADAKRDRALAGQSPNTSLAGYLEWWTDTHLARRAAQGRMAETTRVEYRSVIRTHITPRIGDIPLTRVTVGVVEDLLDRAAHEPSPSTGRPLSPRRVGMVYEVLRAALATATRRELIGRNPAELVEPPRREKKRVDVMGRDDARRFVEAARAHRLEALWCVALAAGLRLGEALAITWPRVDLDAGAVEIGPSLSRRDRRWLWTEGKSHKVETVALPDFAAQAMRRQRTRQAEERLWAGPAWAPEPDLDELVFTTPEGKPLHHWQVSRDLHRVCVAAGVAPMTPHGLRHSCASLLIAQGASMAEVQLLLRHSTQAVTSAIYSHLLPEARREAADRMDAMFGGVESSE